MPRQPNIMTIEELNQVATRLAATAKYLDGLSRSAAAPGGAPVRRGRPPKAGKRAPAGNASEIESKIVSTLKSASNGLSTSDLAAKTGFHKERVSYYLNKMRSEKRVRMTGMRSTARWHA